MTDGAIQRPGGHGHAPAAVTGPATTGPAGDVAGDAGGRRARSAGCAEPAVGASSRLRAWWALYRVQLKAGLVLSPSTMGGQRAARLGPGEWLLFFLSVLAFVPLLWLILIIAVGTYYGLAALGQGEAMLTLFFLPAFVLSLVLGLISVLSIFYFARDTAHLLSLPLSPGAIAGAKLAVVLTNQWLGLALLVPPLVVYGVLAGAGPLYWLKAVVVYALLPVPALALAAILAMALMRVAGRTRQRDWAVVASSLALMAVALGAQILPRQVAENVDPARLNQLMQGLAEQIGRYAPPAVWATRALATGSPAGGAGYLALLGLVAAATLALSWVLADRLLVRGLAAALEAPARRAALDRQRVHAQLARVRPGLLALVWREWAVLWRTPVFVMNTLFPMLVVPVVLATSLWAGPGDTLIRPAVSGLFTPSGRPWAPLAGVAVSAIAGLFAMLGATALSREGRAFWISQVIPASPRRQVAAKLLFACLVAWAGGLPFGAAAGILLGWTGGAWAYWLVTGLLAVVAVNALELAVDLWRPKLDWVDPQGAMKQNYNVLLGVLAGMVSLGGAALVARYTSPLGPAVLLASVCGYLLLVATGGILLVLGLAGRVYRRVSSPSS